MPPTSLDNPVERLLRIADVIALVGLSKSEIYKRIAAGTFPRPVSCGPRAVRWRETDLQIWIAARQEAPARLAIPRRNRNAAPPKDLPKPTGTRHPPKARRTARPPLADAVSATPAAGAAGCARDPREPANNPPSAARAR